MFEARGEVGHYKCRKESWNVPTSSRTDAWRWNWIQSFAISADSKIRSRINVRASGVCYWMERAIPIRVYISKFGLFLNLHGVARLFILTRAKFCQIKKMNLPESLLMMMVWSKQIWQKQCMKLLQSNQNMKCRILLTWTKNLLKILTSTYVI